jgi:hypothetical protein
MGTLRTETPERNKKRYHEEKTEGRSEGHKWVESVK